MDDTSPEPHRKVGPRYPWTLVGLLWFCGFFNYADRQAVNAVLPLLKAEFHLSSAQQGLIASSFMIVYALAGPIAGFVVDRTSRRVLIATGLGFWSLIAAGTGLARSFVQLVGFRAAEGLGESFYFPATMSILSDYHGPKTRSRAMSLHQTSVYVGIVGGSIFAGYVAQRAGWRLPFYILGIVGFIYSMFLFRLIVEPPRGLTDGKPPAAPREVGFLANIAAILRTPAAPMLLVAFIAANFVAAALYTWLPSYVHEKFPTNLMWDNFTATIYLQGGSLVGALLGGVLADRAARWSKGGRMLVQAMALLVGAPCILMVGQVETMRGLVLALIGIGLAKGVYDANIFASLYDVIAPELRGTGAGLMNTVAWAGASLAPVAVGLMADRSSLGLAIGSTASVYVVAASVAAVAAWVAGRSRPKPILDDLA